VSVQFLERVIMRGRQSARIALGNMLSMLPVSSVLRKKLRGWNSGLHHPQSSLGNEPGCADVVGLEQGPQEAARAFLLACREMFSTQQFENVASAVLALDNGEHAVDRRYAAYFQARLLCFDSLLSSGKGGDAGSYLDLIESTYGASWWTYTRRANLGLFFRDKKAALDAVEKAFLCVPVGGYSNSAYQKTVKLKMSLLCQLERYDEAWAFFLQACDHRSSSHPLGASLLAALRRTVTSESRLEEYRMLLLPYFSFKGKRALSALFHYSIAARDLGNYDEALRAIERRLIVGTSVVNFGDSVTSRKSDWTILARRALLDLRHDLAAGGIDFFLISGTLLGCVREGDVLAHDKDFDVGVMDSFSVSDIRRALEDSGRFMVIPGPRDSIVRVKHANGVLGDIFRHWEEDGRILHEGQKTRWWNSPFTLKQTTFLGESFLIPEDVDRYLTENYGSWRVPEVDFETFCDTPNMIVSEKKELLWYFYRALFDYYQTGAILKIQKVVDRLEELVHPTRELELVLDRLKRRINSGTHELEGQ
jgi:tetratricopeptide (TPR) repeat protein